MKDRKNRNLTIVLAICLLSAFVISCGRTDTGEESEAADEVARNLLCLRDGDTESLIGMSFGDEFDYDRYVSRASSGEGWHYYSLKGSEYDSMYFLFNGKGNGFSGLTQFGGDFLGVAVGEDTVETLSDVLGAYTVENKRTYNGTDTWAIWDFETATLSAKIKDGTIQTMQYLAKGDIADVPEKPEEETDFGRDRRETEGRVETVYNWRAYGSESKGPYAVYDPRSGPYDDVPEEYDESTRDEFLHEYLLDQGIRKEEPDGVIYDQNGDPYVEYYVDGEDGKYCFIFHMWGNYLVDYDQGIHQYKDALYCTAYTPDEDDLFGYIIYEEDTEQNRYCERLYDRNGKKMAEAAYEYIPEMPFPLVVESWNLDSFHPKLLIRNQKTWFYMERAQFDSEGKLIAYNGRTGEGEGGEYLTYLCQATYDMDGRLTQLREEPAKEEIEEAWGWWDEAEDYSGWMKFGYSEGVISSVDYRRTSYVYGTTDDVGHIDYDEKGRMLCNDYYITHGSDSDIYLYEGDSDMPWCVIRWCGFAPGFEDIYLFLPEEQ